MSDDMRASWQLWDGHISDERCEEIIEACKKYEPIQGGTFNQEQPNDEIRSSTIRWVQEEEDIRRMMLMYGKSANKNEFNVAICDLWEVQFTEYHGDVHGFYTWHHDVDFHRNSGYDRKLSVVIQLSDPNDYEGGDFRFEECETPQFKTRGSVLVFPSYWRHMVSPVTEGTRHSLVAWIEGPRWR